MDLSRPVHHSPQAQDQRMHLLRLMLKDQAKRLKRFEFLLLFFATPFSVPYSQRSTKSSDNWLARRFLDDQNRLLSTVTETAYCVTRNNSGSFWIDLIRRYSGNDQQTINELLDSIPLETPRFRQAKSDSNESLNESEIEDLSDASFIKVMGSKFQELLNLKKKYLNKILNPKIATC